MTDLGLIGVWLLVVSAIAIVIECVLAGLWGFRISRKSQSLNRRMADDQRLIQADADRLRAAMAETAAMWRPYRRLLRFLQHPLFLALVQSYARRRAGAR